MNLNRSADADWELWGDKNPYFAVIGDPRCLDANLDGAAIQEFFSSGERHVEHLYEVIRKAIRPEFQPARVLDYGCGTGRLVIPFSARAQTVVGIDISTGMLKKARGNCDKFGASSAQLLHLDEMPSLAPGSFDFVHSFIVFQHIPVAEGELILHELIELLAEGGIGALHFTYSRPRSVLKRAALALRYRFRIVHKLVNLIKGRSLSAPGMQMNEYSMNRIFNILMDAHCTIMRVEFSDHSGARGAMLYFEKSSSRISRL
jgi:ubiquinone/menaquinone biosynthesis C-methylase UbiE